MQDRSLEEVIRVAEFRSALRRFLSEGERIAARNGITVQRYLLLLLIKGAPDGSERSTVTELTSRLHLAQTTVTELVDRAVQVGLVRRESFADDRRVARLRLTAKGERRLAASFRDLAVEREALFSAINLRPSTSQTKTANDGH